MTQAILGSALFFVAAPSVLAGLIPWWITRWEFLPPFFDLQATRVVGILLIVAGLPGLVDSFARFALQGLGTPAPIAPTQNLVVTGLYRYVRNPIAKLFLSGLGSTQCRKQLPSWAPLCSSSLRR